MTDTTPERQALERERLASIEQRHVGEQLQQINARLLPPLGRRMMAVINKRKQTDTGATKALYEAVEPLAREVGKLAACRKGCSHCCHVAVAINQAEAELIARATGRKAAKPANRASEGRQEFADTLPLGYGNPCPFLKGNQCSIYAVRPMACRLQFNMDIDAELCRLDQGVNKVPFYRHLDVDKLAVHAAGGPYHITIADIREFFPPQDEKTSQGGKS